MQYLPVYLRSTSTEATRPRTNLIVYTRAQSLHPPGSASTVQVSPAIFGSPTPTNSVSAARNSRELRPTALSGQGTVSLSFSTFAPPRGIGGAAGMVEGIGSFFSSTFARGATAGGAGVGDGLIDVDALLDAQAVIAITAAHIS